MMDERYMRQAIKMAQIARKKDEVPVGAIIVYNGKIIAKAYNRRETKKDPIGHAEMLVIKKAAKKLGGWRLSDCSLYVTLEPCPMCAGAIINARIDHVVFGAFDRKAGALGSLYDLAEGKLNHTPKITGGVLEPICASMLTNYFRQKRKNK